MTFKLQGSSIAGELDCVGMALALEWRIEKMLVGIEPQSNLHPGVDGY